MKHYRVQGTVEKSLEFREFDEDVMITNEEEMSVLIFDKIIARLKQRFGQDAKITILCWETLRGQKE